MDPGARGVSAPATAYRVSRSGDTTKMKRAADANPRIYIDHQNGRIYFGNGTITPDAWIGNGGTGYMIPFGHMYWTTDNTHDLGSASYRPRNLFVGTKATVYGEIEIDGALNRVSFLAIAYIGEGRSLQ